MTRTENPIDNNEEEIASLLKGIPMILPETFEWMTTHYNDGGRVSTEWIETVDRISLELERRQHEFSRFIRSSIHQPMIIIDNKQMNAFRWVYITLLVQAGLNKQARDPSYRFTAPTVDLIPVSSTDVTRIKFMQPEETPTWNGISRVLQTRNNGLHRVIRSQVGNIGNERSRAKTLNGIANILLIIGQRGGALRR